MHRTIGARDRLLAPNGNRALNRNKGSPVALDKMLHCRSETCGRFDRSGAPHGNGEVHAN
jgi:hypothetical protein